MALVRTALATHDPDAAAARLAMSFDRVSIVPADPDRFAMRHFLADEGRVAVGSARLDGSGTSTVDAERLHIVAQAVTGDLHLSTARGERTSRGPFLWPAGRLSVRWQDLRLGFVAFDRAVLERRARVLLGDDAFELRFDEVEPPEPLSAYWRAVVHHLVRVFITDPELRQNELLVADAAELVLGAALAVFPGSLSSRGGHDVGGPATTNAVARARRHIDEHYREPIPLDSLVAVSRMSGRGLQAAFRRELGTTPSGYVRQVRLSRAREALRQAAVGDGATVESIAHAHGFGDLSHFAAQYRDRFGESPSQTLRS